MKTFGFQWHLTDRCNLRCRHCYQEGFSPGSELLYEGLARIAEDVCSTLWDGRVSVNLTGGEPFLFPWLSELIDHLHSFPNMDEIHVITNGTVWDPTVMRRLSNSPRVRYIKVSVESGDPQVNDAIRGSGNFGRVKEGVSRFRHEAGKEVVIMATLGRRNVSQIPLTVRFARDAGASGVIFERFVPLGRGKGMAEDVLDAPGWAAAVGLVCGECGVEPDLGAMLPYRAFWLDLGAGASEPLEGATCNLGDESMALMPDGTVFPCRRLPIPVGSLAMEPFRDIRARLADYSVPRMKDRMGGFRCGFCSEWACVGCRALARALTGDVYSDDTQCARWR